MIKKQRTSRTAVVFFLALAAFLAPTFAGAKEARFEFDRDTDSALSGLNYCYNRFDGSTPSGNDIQSRDCVVTSFTWYPGCSGMGFCVPETGFTTSSALGDIRGRVSYYATVKNLTTGLYLTDGATTTVGARLRLEFDSHEPEDIDWSGIGYSMDSPYGEWREGASAPEWVTQSYKTRRTGGTFVTHTGPVCEPDDKVTNTPVTDPYDSGRNYDAYVPLVVDPPSRTITPGPNLSSCTTVSSDSNGVIAMECTVSGAGSITPRFTLNETTGRFYYRYKDNGGNGSSGHERGNYAGCFGNQTPLIHITSPGSIFLPPSYEHFDLEVPTQDIDFTFTAGAAQAAPASPTITGPNSMTCTTPGTPVTSSFTLTATDTNGDQIRYEIDSDNNGVADIFLPSSTGYVPSGTAQTYTRSSSASYTFRARAMDDKSGVSGWVSKTVTMGTCPDTAPVALLTANPATIQTGASTNLQWSCTGSTTSAAIESVGSPSIPLTGTPGTSWSGTVSTGVLNANKTYMLRCQGTGLPSFDDALVTVSTVAQPTATLTCAPPTISSGDSAQISWSSTNATSCSGTNFTTAGATSGQVSTGPLTQSRTYALSCTGPSGTTPATQTCGVTVTGLPDLRAGDIPTATVSAGTTRTLVSSIANVGGEPAERVTYTLFQIDSDANHTSGNEIVIGYDDIADVVPGYAISSSYPYTFNASRWVRACADNGGGITGPAWTSLVTESDENNCGNWTLITVDAPSLTCTASDGSVGVGDPVTFTATPSGGATSPYQWRDTSGTALGGTGSSITRTFDETGTYGTQVRASLVVGGYTAWDTCSPNVTVTCSGADCPCAAEDLTLSAAPDRVNRGQTSTLTYEVPGVDTGVTQCTIRSDKDTSYVRIIPIGSCTTEEGGTETTHAIQTQTTFTLRCGSITETVTVDVVPDVIEI